MTFQLRDSSDVINGAGVVSERAFFFLLLSSLYSALLDSLCSDKGVGNEWVISDTARGFKQRPTHSVKHLNAARASQSEAALAMHVVICFMPLFKEE